MGKTSVQKFAPVSSLRNSLFLKWIPPFIVAVTLAIFLLLPSKGHALDTPAAPAPTTANSWNHLTPIQKRALAPLEKDWASLSADRKQKWLVFADRFQKMKPEDQKRAQDKMDAWVKLTPEQRLAARENYIRSNMLEPDQRAQKWQEYQQLSDEQKAQLANHPDKKKLITNLPTPAESKEKKLQPLKTPKKPISASQPTAPASAPLVTAPAPTPVLPVAPTSAPLTNTN